MTRGATRFVGPVTLSALASEPVRTSLWDEPEPIPHTRLGQSADLIVVAPATARLIGSYAAGISSDLLTATLLATRAPVLLCPAMHTEMWEHPAVVDNIALLRRRGVHVVEPRRGRLAGGDVGAGRLADPADIVASRSLGALRTVHRRARARPALPGYGAVVTAGGTREPIDPVRFIGNRSSGKQGYAVAGRLAGAGRPGHPDQHRRTLPAPPGSRSSRWRRRRRWKPRCMAQAGRRRRGRHGRGRRRLPAQGDRRPEAQEGRRRARRGPRTDDRHPGRPRRRRRPARCWSASPPRRAARDGARDQLRRYAPTSWPPREPT